MLKRFIDHGIFKVAPAVFAALVQNDEDKLARRIRPPNYTKAERDDLCGRIKLTFGDQAKPKHGQNWIVSAASVLEFYLEHKRLQMLWTSLGLSGHHLVSGSPPVTVQLSQPYQAGTGAEPPAANRQRKAAYRRLRSHLLLASHAEIGGGAHMAAAVKMRGCTFNTSSQDAR